MLFLVRKEMTSIILNEFKMEYSGSDSETGDAICGKDKWDILKLYDSVKCEPQTYVKVQNLWFKQTKI